MFYNYLYLNNYINIYKINDNNNYNNCNEPVPGIQDVTKAVHAFKI